MKKKSKLWIVIVIIAIIVIGTIIGAIIYLNSNHLTSSEKKWIDESRETNKVINVNVINNIPVIADNGSGILYDFLNDFSEEYELNLNKVTFDYGTPVNGTTLNAKMVLSKDDELIYKDHYVLVSKKYELINSPLDLNGKTIGVLTNDLSYVSTFLTEGSYTFTSYESSEELFKSLETNNYVIIPLHMYLKNILENNYYVTYHFSDLNMYYTLTVSDDDITSKILKKYFVSWQDEIEESYNDALFNQITSSLKITEADIDSIQRVSYKYGFVNNSPYEVISNGNYGGVVSVYLDGFIDFADLDFNFKRYLNYHKFEKAIAKDEVDMYFGYYNKFEKYKTTTSGIKAKYVIVANQKNDIAISSVNFLKGMEVYVDENSYLETYLKTIEGVNIKTYKGASGLKKLNRKDTIIFIDSNIFEYYKGHGLNNYTVRYEDYLDYEYAFNVKNSNIMSNILDKYINITDPNTVLNLGIYNHEKVVSVGNILKTIAKYFLYLIVIGAIVLFITSKKRKRIKIAKKIKRDDKIKFIDQLTLLKNRNYLKENIKSWSQNTIYPQAVLVIDLNHLRHINDIEGYEEGDKQIKAAANALMKTQLDNSDIIRTDGNEFVVYMVGYSQKQIINYIHKLSKEFNKLPYNYGAEFGYSMILDDIKTIEDALNEATTALKEQKEKNEKKD